MHALRATSVQMASESDGVVDVSIGKPIPSEGSDADELMREAEAWIEAEMRRLDPDAYR